MDQGRETAGEAKEGINARQRAGEIAILLQQARGECLTDVDKVEDIHARELFTKVAGYLEVAVQALYSYQSGDGQPRRTVH
jgi:hypothetical protein